MAYNKEQIIKWAKYCEQGNCASNECPYHKHENCCAYLIKDLLTLTVDVVPRSEVERLREELEKERVWANSMIDNLRDDIRELRKAKQEVAREIFGEIEKNPVVMKSCIFIDKKGYNELKKKCIGE